MSFLMGDFDAWRAKAFFLIDLDGNNPSYEWCFWNKYYGQSIYRQNDAHLAALVKQRAESGNAEAQTDMIKLHILGQGVHVESVEIGKWLQCAVENGEPYAQFMYGYSWKNPYFTTPYLYKTRLELIEQAAASGKEKFFSLVHCMTKKAWELTGYERGGTLLWRIVPLTETEENEYLTELKKLADAGCLFAKWILAGNSYAINSETTRLKVERYKELGEQGIVYAYVELMKILLFNESLEIDYDGALGCIEKFRTFPNDGIWTSMAGEILIYVQGDEDRRNRLNSCAQWLFKKAAVGDVNAQLFPAILCNELLLNNREMEIKWLLLAALNDSSTAYDLLPARCWAIERELQLQEKITIFPKNSRSDFYLENKTIDSVSAYDVECLKSSLVQHASEKYGGEKWLETKMKFEEHIFSDDKDRPLKNETCLANFCRWVLEEMNSHEYIGYLPSKQFLAGDEWYLNPEIESSLMSAVNAKIRSNKDEDFRDDYISDRYYFPSLGTYYFWQRYL